MDLKVWVCLVGWFKEFQSSTLCSWISLKDGSNKKTQGGMIGLLVIGSMGWMVYLSTIYMFMVDFYGFHVGKYAIVPWMLWDIFTLRRDCFLVADKHDQFSPVFVGNPISIRQLQQTLEHTPDPQLPVYFLHTCILGYLESVPGSVGIFLDCHLVLWSICLSRSTSWILLQFGCIFCTQTLRF